MFLGSPALPDSVPEGPLLPAPVGGFMNPEAFKNPVINKVLRDYTQFPNKVLTSVRGGLKTFNAQKLLLDDYFNKGWFFGTLRESEEELLSMLRGGFWDNELISQEPYCRHSYTTVGKNIIIDNVVVGVGVALHTYGKFRMSNVGCGKKYKTREEKELDDAEQVVLNFGDKLRTIFFDEFEPIAPTMSAADRVTAYKHITSTFFRLRPGFQAIFAGNLKFGHSPILEMLNFKNISGEPGIRKSYTLKTHRPLAVWAHLQPNEAWKEALQNSYVGMIIEGKNDDMFETGRPFAGTDFVQIPAKPLHRFVLYNLSVPDAELSFWKTREGIYYVTDRTKNTCYPTYTFKLQHCKKGVNLIPDSYKRAIQSVFERGCVQFDCARNYEAFKNAIAR